MHQYFSKFQFDSHPIIDVNPSKKLGLIIIIPCFNEDNMIDSLKSLQSCEKPNCSVEIIVVINCSEEANLEVKKKQKATFDEIIYFVNMHNLKYPIYPILRTELPKKHAGVGLARKIGMDEASYRLLQSENPIKTLICFDADSKCSSNYLIEIEKVFRNKNITGASIYFEHSIEGVEFDEKNYEAIIYYELFLRYYYFGLKYAGLPYAYHTVGSSMSCTLEAYLKQGGMSKKKAGEDFYFIHKIISLGNFYEIKNATVLPSSRISNRTPFGTGRSVGNWVKSDKKVFYTYSFDSFNLIKHFVDLFFEFYQNGIDEKKIPKALKKYLFKNGFKKAWTDAKIHTTSFKQFKKRFFVWFGPFQIVKLLHYLRDEVNGKKELFFQVNLLLKKMDIISNCKDEKEQLLLLRKIEKS